MTNLEKKIIAALGVTFVVILAVVAVVFRQQKTINSLSDLKSNMPSNELVKHFVGTIESISGNQMTISTKLADLSRPKDPNKLKGSKTPTNLTSHDFEILEKKISVITNKKTVFGKKPLTELKVGDMVSVISDKSPYTANAVTAEKIIFFELPK